VSNALNWVSLTFFQNKLVKISPRFLVRVLVVILIINTIFLFVWFINLESFSVVKMHLEFFLFVRETHQVALAN
jgi:hypothetical protein